MTSKLIWSGLAVAVLATTSLAAQAADIPARAPAPVYTKAPVAAIAAVGWNGCYVGGNVGYGASRVSVFDPTLLIDDGSHTARGWVGGGQAGCDFQTGPWVFGIQGMFDWSGIRGENLQPLLGATNTTRIPWFGTVTGRIGYAVQPNALLYAKGGVAWVRDRFAGVSNIAPFVGVTFATADTTRTGWTIGGGLEYMLAPSWSVFAEYNYIGLGTNRVTFATVPPFAAGTFPIDIKQDVQFVAVGVNYRFNMR
jgi:outer membrane immunogenic protein